MIKKFSEQEAALAVRMYLAKKYGTTTISRVLALKGSTTAQSRDLMALFKQRGISLHSTAERQSIALRERARPEFKSKYYYYQVAREFTNE